MSTDVLLPVDKVSAAKFAADGRPRYYPGTTISAPLIRQAVVMEQLLQLRDHLQHMPAAEAFSFLPPQCWHMTVLRGVNLRNRRVGPWPLGLSRDASLPQVMREMTRRMRHVVPPRSIEMRATSLGMTEAGDIRLVLRGADLRAEMAQARLRRQLALALRHPSPVVRSTLHLTLAYRVRPIRPSSLAEIKSFLDRAPRLRSQIYFGRPLLLAYRDMWDFAHRSVPASGASDRV